MFNDITNVLKIRYICSADIYNNWQRELYTVEDMLKMGVEDNGN